MEVEIIGADGREAVVRVKGGPSAGDVYVVQFAGRSAFSKRVLNYSNDWPRAEDVSRAALKALLKGGE